MTPNHNAIHFKKLAQHYMTLRSDAPRFVGTIAQNFFKKSFDVQGMQLNGRVQKWHKRGGSITKRKGRQLLVDRGRLKRGINKRVGNKQVKIGVDATVEKYAAILNNGGQIPITLKMRKFFWAKFYEAMGGKVYSVKTKTERKNKRNANLNADALFWRNMALSKNKFITIKPRPFIYHSSDLVKEINTQLHKAIINILNKSK